MARNALYKTIAAHYPSRFYKLDEVGGVLTAIDAGLNKQNLSHTNNPIVGGDGPKIGMKAVEYDNGSNAVSIGNATAITDQQTIIVIAKSTLADNPDVGEYIFSSQVDDQNRCAMSFLANGVPVITHEYGDDMLNWAFSTDLYDAGWHLYVMTVDHSNGIVSGIVDGVADGAKNTSVARAGINGHFSIGAQNYTGANAFDGSVALVAIIDSLLTAKQVGYLVGAYLADDSGEESTPAPTARFRFDSDTSDEQGAFSDLTGGAGVDLDGSANEHSYAANFAIATSQLQLDPADVASVSGYTAFTLSVWFKCGYDEVIYSISDSTAGQYNGLMIWTRSASTDFRITKHNGSTTQTLFTLGVNAGNVLTNPIYTGDSSWDSNTIHHLVLAVDNTGTSHSILIDGVDVTSIGAYNVGTATDNITPSGLSITPDTIGIGGTSYASNPNNRLSHGAFADVRLWNSRLVDDQSRALFVESMPRDVIGVVIGQSNAKGTDDKDGVVNQNPGGRHAGRRRLLQQGRGYNSYTATGTYNPSFADIADGAIGPGIDPYHNVEGAWDGVGAIHTANLIIMDYWPDNYSMLASPCAQGSTSFGAGNWIKGGANYDDAVARVRAAVAINPAFSVLAFAYFNLGESDSTPTFAPLFKAALINFLSDFRTDVGDENLLVIGAGRTDAWLAIDTNGNKASVLNDTIEVFNSTPNCRWVDTTGLKSDEEVGGLAGVVHFCAEANESIGKKVAVEYLAAKGFVGSSGGWPYPRVRLIGA